MEQVFGTQNTSWTHLNKFYIDRQGFIVNILKYLFFYNILECSHLHISELNKTSQNNVYH